MKKIILALVLPVLLLVLWYIAVLSGNWSTYLLPPPKEVGRTALSLWSSGELGQHILISLKRVALGFAVAAITATPLAIVLGMNRKFYQLLRPTLEFFRHVPPLSLLPIVILWLGIGEMAKLSIVFMATFYPIFLNVLSGLTNTDTQALELGEHYGLSKKDQFLHIRLPYAAPYVFTGFRLGLGYSWRSLIGAEMIAAASGLGYLILDAEALARPDIVLVGIFAIGLAGIVVDKLFCTLAFYLFPQFLEKQKGGNDDFY